MRNKALILSVAALAWGGSNSYGQGVVYKALYVPPSLSAPGPNPIVTLEVQPGFFYLLSVRETSTFGPTVFSVTSEGVSGQVYEFPASSNMGVLVEATNSVLYGPAILPSAPNWLYSLQEGGRNFQQFPYPGQYSVGSPLIVAPTAMYEQTGFTQGTTQVFSFARISETGQFTILHQFSGTDGFPNTKNWPIYGPDGNFYGIGNQQQYGISPGFIYKFTPMGAYSQLLTFPYFPTGGGSLPLVAGADGNLYGSFNNRGTNGTGEIYQATLTGQFHTMASFPATGMSQPRSLVQAADGNLYGSTNFNQIFRYNTASHALALVYQMAADSSQGKCECQLVEGMDGKLYGATPNGGPTGLGVVFSLEIGLPKPLPVVSEMVPASGPVGQKVILWGNWLLGVKSVTFNGTPAVGPISTSVQSVLVTVPSGATSGPVTVTTGNGSVTTTQGFTVQ